MLAKQERGLGGGQQNHWKTVTSVHELYRSPPPRPSSGPHAKCARILRGNPPAAGAARPAGEGYFGGLPRFGLPYGNPLKVSPAAGFVLQGRGIFCGRYAGLFVAPTPTLPHGGGGYRRFVLLRFALWQSSESLPRCGLRPTGEGDFLRSLRGVVCCPHPDPPPRGRGYFGGLSCFGLPYDNPPKVSTASQGRGRQPT